MGSVPVPIRGQLDANEGVQAQHPEPRRRLGLTDVRVRERLVGTNLLVGKDDVDGLAGLRLGAVEEQVDSLAVPVDEARRSQCGACGVEIGT